MRAVLLKTAVAVLAVAVEGVALVGAAPAEPTPSGLPYVYTDWTHFTTKNGLPNDHVFAIKVDGNNVWVGTEDGLALIDKAQKKVVRVWKEADGLPFKVVSSIDVDRNGDVWLGMFGGGLARLSGGRFDHWHQLNSGLVNDVVYGVACDRDKNQVWIATTAGASRFDPKTEEWTIYNEKNAPMEEIWNYGVTYRDGKVFLGVWGSGVLEFDTTTEKWDEYTDPDGEMEIDLYRDDGIVHVITTGVSYIDHTLWASTYFGGSRYDGRHWRGYFDVETGLPSNFMNSVKGRSANEGWFATDKGVGVVTDVPSDTWVTYTMDPETHRGQAVVSRNKKVLETVESEEGIPHNYALWIELDGPDVWVATSKGIGWGHGEGYYAGLEDRPPVTASGARGVVVAGKH